MEVDNLSQLVIFCSRFYRIRQFSRLAITLLPITCTLNFRIGEDFNTAVGTLKYRLAKQRHYW